MRIWLWTEKEKWSELFVSICICWRSNVCCCGLVTGGVRRKKRKGEESGFGSAKGARAKGQEPGARSLKVSGGRAGWGKIRAMWLFQDPLRLIPALTKHSCSLARL